MGSAGSGKSFHIAQKILIRAISQPIRIVVCRRYGTTIRNSVFALFKQILTSWKINRPDIVKVNESDYRITFLQNGSQILFLGLDEETKLLSLTDISVIWVEEAFEVNREIVEQLNLRLRGSSENQQIILSFNPISINSWLYEFTLNPPQSYIFHHSTYKDNKFLTQEYINELEELRERNPAKARIFCDGEWGINPEGLVIKNYQLTPLNNMELASKGYERRIGSDLGFIDPTTIIDTFYDKQNHTIYVFNEYSKCGQQLDNVYDAMIKMQVGKNKIYMDSAEPRSIEYFKKRGINTLPCIKGADSVRAGLSFLQNNKIIVDPNCKNMIADLSNFSYQKDKRTGQYIEGQYTHEWSHCIDALRYAYSDIYKNTGLQTFDKALLNL